MPTRVADGPAVPGMAGSKNGMRLQRKGLAEARLIRVIWKCRATGHVSVRD